MRDCECVTYNLALLHLKAGYSSEGKCKECMCVCVCVCECVSIHFYS